MEAKDPTQTDAIARWWESPHLDEAPTFTTRQHLEYLVGLITKEWKKTMVKWHNASDDTVTVPFPELDELELFDPDEDSVIKFHVGPVPESIFHKVDTLQHMQRIGLPHLPALTELAKEELAKSPFAHVPDEDGNNETSFIDMLKELAKNRIYAEFNKKEVIEFNLTVVFVDESGNMRLQQCRLQHDTDFASFLVLMDCYPEEFNQNVIWAASFWDDKIRELKEKGYDGHPKLVEIEKLIAAHKARDYDAGPKWMFYKTNKQVAYAKSIEDEKDLKKILEIVANPAKNNQLACMVRAVDKDLILISDELKFFQARLQNKVASSDPAALLPTHVHLSDEQPKTELTSGINSFIAGECSFNFLARTLGVGYNFASLMDDHDKEEDEQPRWSLVKDIDKS